MKDIMRDCPECKAKESLEYIRPQYLKAGRYQYFQCVICNREIRIGPPPKTTSDT